MRPRRILLPQAAQRVTHGVRQIHGPEAPDLAFVEPQEPPARRKIVVNNVEDLAFHSRRQAGPDDRIRTVVDEGERQRVEAAQVQEQAECPDTDPAGDGLFAGAVPRNRAGRSHRAPHKFCRM